MIYNKHKTAYWRSGDWYLIPRGKDRAPWFYWKDGPRIPNDVFVRRPVVDEITEEDRQMLLEARDEGVYREVWARLSLVLGDREDMRISERNEKARQITDRYWG